MAPFPVETLAPAGHTARLAGMVAAAIRAGLPMVPEAVDERTALALDALAAELDGAPRERPAEMIVARFAPALPRSLNAALATAAAGGDGLGAVAALAARASGGTTARWRFRIDLVYPLVICALAAAGVAWLTWWYGPLVAAVDDTLTGPRANAVFDARPVTDVIGWPVVGWCAASVLVLATMLTAAWRGLVGSAASAGRLMEVVDALPDPSARNRARAAVADHERLVAVHLRQEWGRVPAVVGSLVAGGAVLVYGIGLFQPLVKLMRDVADQPTVAEWRGARPETGR